MLFVERNITVCRYLKRVGCGSDCDDDDCDNDDGGGNSSSGMMVTTATTATTTTATTAVATTAVATIDCDCHYVIDHTVMVNYQTV